MGLSNLFKKKDIDEQIEEENIKLLQDKSKHEKMERLQSLREERKKYQQPNKLGSILQSLQPSQNSESNNSFRLFPGGDSFSSGLLVDKPQNDMRMHGFMIDAPSKKIKTPKKEKLPKMRFVRAF